MTDDRKEVGRRTPSHPSADSSAAETIEERRGRGDPEHGTGRQPGLVRRAFQRFLSDDCPRLAAAIAYYVLFSIIPALTLLIAAFGVVLTDPVLEERVVAQAVESLPFGTERNRELVMEAVRGVTAARGGLSLMGLAGFVWATLGLFAAVRWALNRAFGVQARSLVRQRLVDLATAVTLWVLLSLSVLGTAALHALGRVISQGVVVPGDLAFVWTALEWITPIVFTFLAFLLLYRYVPHVDHGFRMVLPGAIAGALLFEVAKHGFILYVSRFSHHEALFGILGGVMLFMLWTYVSAVILLFGAEIAAARRR